MPVSAGIGGTVRYTDA
ncbi:cobyrinic acid a,c-diamide synthase [Roseibium aggregatum IAM 12614]|uniref:Cobyrinic acid a,c-diamide synthase n=1 Tax=Roseibium aggregatum (strain ATCC 25650 / DSM 13394 / JCM 20685 / NBRC 16684 / NCIMB 2208 / IAM 12614 / B1) TaxID=384765 RepID=A0NRN9_ROSAI|nr:cobyrinic acid a,c-diamide synthase [Roseibium aggregatum IAM 12614]